MLQFLSPPSENKVMGKTGGEARPGTDLAQGPPDLGTLGALGTLGSADIPTTGLDLHVQGSGVPLFSPQAQRTPELSTGSTVTRKVWGFGATLKLTLSPPPSMGRDTFHQGRLLRAFIFI